MKRLSYALCALIFLSAPALADQGQVVSFCQNGAAIAACPPGVPSNTTVPWAQQTGNSIAAGQNTNTSVSNNRNDNRSVGVSPSFNTTDSVAQIQAHSNTSVAFSGGASSNSVSSSVNTIGTGSVASGVGSVSR